MGITTSNFCLGRDTNIPQRFAELSPEEAYMLKKQQDLRIFIYSCKDIK